MRGSTGLGAGRARGRARRRGARRPNRSRSSKRRVGARFDAGLAEALDARILELDGRAAPIHPSPARLCCRRTPDACAAPVAPCTARRDRRRLPRNERATLRSPRPSRIEASPRSWRRPLERRTLAGRRLRPPISPSRRFGSRPPRTRTMPAGAFPRSRPAPRRRRPASEPTRCSKRRCRAAAPGIERATVLAHLARVQVSPQRAIALYDEALLEAQGDNALQATIHFGLAMWMRLGGDGFRRALEHAELAVSLASDIVDAELRCQVLGEYGRTHFAAGRGIAWETMEGALSAERSLDGWPLHDGPTFRFGEQLLWSVHLDRARALFQDARDAGLARNDPVVESDALWGLGFVEWRAGNWEKAERYTADSIDLQKQLGRLLPHDELPAAIIWAHQGRVEDARARAQAAIARADTEDMRIPQSGHGWVLGFVELSLGDARVALAFLRRSYELRDTDALDPGERLELGDLLEALISVGELDEAERCSRRGMSAPPRSTGPGHWRSLLAVAGCCWPREEISTAPSRASSARSPNTPVPGSVPARANAARSRQDAEACEEARRRPRNPRGRAGPLRAARRAALGRADARRADPHRRACALERRADRGRAPDRHACRRGPYEPRGGGGSLPDRALRGDNAHACLPQVGSALARRARAPFRRKQLRFPAFGARRRLRASGRAELPRRDVSRSGARR